MALITQCLIQSAWKLTSGQEKQIIQKISALSPKTPLDFTFQTDPALLTGLRLTINGMEFDLTAQGALHQLSQHLHQHSLINTPDKIPFLKKQIDQIHKKMIVQEVGTVLSVTDGIVKVSGFQNVALGERLTFHSHAKGLVLNLQKDFIEVGLLNKETSVQEGERVYRSHKGNTIGVGPAFLGRVIDPTGTPLDDKESIESVEERPVNTPAPSIIDRAKVTTPFHTGIKSIDALIPIGHGQRELIIGDRQTGKTTLILDMILAQKEANQAARTPKEKVYSVYVAIGQKQSAIRSFVQTLEEQDVLKDTIIVSAPASSTATVQYLAPYAGCTIAEYFRDKGLRVVIFYDDLTKHAVAYREMSLLMKHPSGREAYPSDIFYIHAKLLERAGQLNAAKGGGSLTAIPVIETQEGDISAYIPTNVISITDGQIFLQTDLFNQGFRPAIDIGLSVSRVGGNAQTKLLRTLATHLKLDLSQYHEMLNFAQFETDLDPGSQALLQQGARLSALLKQGPHQPVSYPQEVALFSIADAGLLETIPLDKIETITTAFCDLLAKEHPEKLRELATQDTLSAPLKEALKNLFIQITENVHESSVGPEKQD